MVIQDPHPHLETIPTQALTAPQGVCHLNLPTVGRTVVSANKPITTSTSTPQAPRRRQDQLHPAQGPSTLQVHHLLVNPPTQRIPIGRTLGDLRLLPLLLLVALRRSLAPPLILQRRWTMSMLWTWMKNKKLQAYPPPLLKLLRKARNLHGRILPPRSVGVHEFPPSLPLFPIPMLPHCIVFVCSDDYRPVLRLPIREASWS